MGRLGGPCLSIFLEFVPTFALLPSVQYKTTPWHMLFSSPWSYHISINLAFQMIISSILINVWDCLSFKNISLSSQFSRKLFLSSVPILLSQSHATSPSKVIVKLTEPLASKRELEYIDIRHQNYVLTAQNKPMLQGCCNSSNIDHLRLWLPQDIFADFKSIAGLMVLVWKFSTPSSLVQLILSLKVSHHTENVKFIIFDWVLAKILDARSFCEANLRVSQKK